MKAGLKILLNSFINSGIWLQPICLAIIVVFTKEYHPEWLLDSDMQLAGIMLSVLPVLVIWMDNTTRINADDAISGRDRAARPSCPSELLSEKPEGLILGQVKAKGIFGKKSYIRKPLDADGHLLVIGGSGSGKSSCMAIPTLLANANARIIAVDIKGELSFKTRRYDDDRVRIFNPQNRDGYGYDVFYKLGPGSTAQEVLEVIQGIAYALIPLPAKDPFWARSARSLFCGLALMYYNSGCHDFIGIIDKILSTPIRDSIAMAMDNSPAASAEYKFLSQFSSMSDETLFSVLSELSVHINTLSTDQDLRYCLQTNPLKCSPADIDAGDGCDFFIAIKAEKIKAYYDLLQLVISQLIGELELRPEGSPPVVFILDELPRLLESGKIDSLLSTIKVIRSHGVTLVEIVQSLEGLMTAYTENEVTDIISNSGYILVLDASSMKTQKIIVNAAGKCRVRKKSWSNTSGSKDKWHTSISFEEVDILQPSDLTTLKNTGEAILISPHGKGYCRIKKTPYYKDKMLKPLSDAAVSHNKALLNSK